MSQDVDNSVYLHIFFLGKPRAFDLRMLGRIQE